MNLALFASLAFWGLQLRRRVDEVEDRIGAITEETVSRSRLRELELRRHVSRRKGRVYLMLASQLGGIVDLAAKRRQASCPEAVADLQ